MKRSELCPRKDTCINDCYGSQTCKWAELFDSVVKTLECWRRNTEEAERKPPKTNRLIPRFYGDYVFSPCQNAFNGKTSWWLSKKNCTRALYCFTAETGEEADYQLYDGGARAYIRMFEEVIKC